MPCGAESPSFAYRLCFRTDIVAQAHKVLSFVSYLLAPQRSYVCVKRSGVGNVRRSIAIQQRLLVNVLNSDGMHVPTSLRAHGGDFSRGMDANNRSTSSWHARCFKHHAPGGCSRERPLSRSGA
jgi:hypothetical protein